MSAWSHVPAVLLPAFYAPAGSEPVLGPPARRSGAWDRLPAHLVPVHEVDTEYRQRPVPVRLLHGDFGTLTIGTPPSPETALVPCEQRGRPNLEFPASDLEPSAYCRQPPPIVTIRQAGPHGSDLYVRTGDGAQLVIVPLSYGLLVNLLEDATAGLRRCEETR